MRFAEEKDVPAIRAIAEASWNETYVNIISKEQIAYMLDWMYGEDVLKQYIHSGEQLFLLKEEAGEVLGFIAYTFHRPAEDVCRLHKLYLRPDQKGKGLGKRLVEEVKLRASEAGMKEIQLNVNKQNPAFSFYVASGFEVLREEVLDIGNGFVMDDYVMVYTL
jgi:ribosomal protein S18 acetylase RimI-like enzyme